MDTSGITPSPRSYGLHDFSTQTNELAGASRGGAICLDQGDAFLSKCRLVNNSAGNPVRPDDDRGGAIYLDSGSSLDMLDSDLSRRACAFNELWNRHSLELTNEHSYITDKRPDFAHFSFKNI